MRERMSTVEYLARIGERPTRQQRERDELVHPLMEAFQRCGWMVHHEEDSRRDTRSNNGFPDLVAVKFPHRVVAECKLDGLQVSEDQARWLTQEGKFAEWHPLHWVCVWHLSNYDAALGYIRRPHHVKPPGVWGG